MHVLDPGLHPSNRKFVFWTSLKLGLFGFMLGFVSSAYMAVVRGWEIWLSLLLGGAVTFCVLLLLVLTSGGRTFGNACMVAFGGVLVYSAFPLLPLAPVLLGMGMVFISRAVSKGLVTLKKRPFG